jgi:NTP pyrophosphatase (non-canonical NTP hydrolase)
MNKFELIRQWAKERGIYDKGDVKTQLIKLYEETGELSEAILKGNQEEFVDAIGDAIVVLTNLAALGDVDIEHCIDHAYGEIVSRTGNMVNGTFVKDK